MLAFGPAGHGDLQSEDRSNLSGRGTLVKCNVLDLFEHARSPSTIRSPVADACMGLFLSRPQIWLRFCLNASLITAGEQTQALSKTFRGEADGAERNGKTMAILSTMVGALVLSRTLNDPDLAQAFLHAAVEQVRAAVAA